MSNNKAGVQDNQREIEIANLFGLTRGQSRIDVDAFDELGNPFELKTSAKKSVSTARDLGPDHINKWRSRYWIIGIGRNLAEGYRYDAFYFLAPEHMETWYRKIEDGFERDKQITDEVLALLPEDFNSRKRQRLQYMLRRGMLLNDPNIPWSYIQKWGIKIIDAYPQRLAELVRQYPLAEAALRIASLNIDDELFSMI